MILFFLRLGMHSVVWAAGLDGVCTTTLKSTPTFEIRAAETSEAEQVRIFKEMLAQVPGFREKMPTNPARLTKLIEEIEKGNVSFDVRSSEKVLNYELRRGSAVLGRGEVKNPKPRIQSEKAVEVIEKPGLPADPKAPYRASVLDAREDYLVVELTSESAKGQGMHPLYKTFFDSIPKDKNADFVKGLIIRVEKNKIQLNGKVTLQKLFTDSYVVEDPKLAANLIAITKRMAEKFPLKNK